MQTQKPPLERSGGGFIEIGSQIDQPVPVSFRYDRAGGGWGDECFQGQFINELAFFLLQFDTVYLSREY